MHSTTVIVKQTQNNFPIGTCISRTNIDNEDFVAYFVKNFNWAMFENELKWYWTVSQQRKLNYKDADNLLKLCDDDNIAARGHCIFWDVDNTVQDWVKNLSKTDLATAVVSLLAIPTKIKTS
ncbi:glycosyl hydrolase family 10 protein / carbohydrate-binding domain-containing protein [Artemisia annua]|uniref:Glycosyl hydrolase family 10 protein / carbohydrate-binding domain-containing protein n=1 Tax=Artemisia annua TaxID=35608 RepID=A0A2U1QMX1_ARTAN|nr:glycosyl hydrolase family 10 protein / carbohydrate-binding domain-containing protein [Artemisia annua]